MRRTRFALVAFLAAFMAALMSASLAAAQDPVAGDFQKVTLDDNTQNPMELDIAPDGRVFYIERDGRLQIWKPDTRQTVDRRARSRSRGARRTACSASARAGLRHQLGLPLLLRSCPDSPSTQVVSRFKVDGDTLDLAPSRRSSPSSTRASSAATRPARCPSAPTAASTSRRATTRTRSTPTASTRSTSAPAASTGTRSARRRNTNDLNGKILRIKPVEIPTGTPGVGTTYTIPAGNLFAEAQRAEDAGRRSSRMGFRNPFRFTVDPKTGWVLMGDYGPDAGTTNAEPRPAGLGRVQRRHEGRQLRLAVLHPRQRRLQRLQLRDRAVGREVRLRRAGQRLAQQHRPDEPAAGQPATTRGWATARPTRASRGPRHRRRPDGRPALPLRPDARLADASSRRSTTTSGSSASGTTAGSRRPTSTTTAATA